ncbi:hypothetical protein ACI8AK_03930 [Geodermatophilus sp. SYSU D00867]
MDLVLLAATGVHEQLKDSTPLVKPLVLVSLAQEATVGAWWTSVLLGTSGVVLGAVAGTRRRGRESGWRVAVPALGGTVLIGLSLDELASLHERLLLDDVGGAAHAFDGAGPWLVPGLPALLLVVLGLRRLTHRPVDDATWLCTAGTLCLSTILLQEDLEHSLDFGAGRPPWLTVVEEGTELLGSLLLLAGALDLLRSAGPAAVSDLGRALWRHRRSEFIAGAALLVFGTLAADVLVDRTVGDDQLGLPQYWTASLAAGALAGAVLAWSRLTLRQPDRAADALAGAALLLSVLHGIDAFTWAVRLADTDVPIRVGTAVLLLVPTLLLVRRSTRIPVVLTAVAAVVLLLDDGPVGWPQVAVLSLASLAWLEPSSPHPSPSSTLERTTGCDV